MNASLHKVRNIENGAVFRVVAPAAAGQLTKTDGQHHGVWRRLRSALPGCTLEVERGRDGKWYVKATRKAAEPTRAAVRERIHRNRNVQDNDGLTAGKHHCERCAGTGRYITHVENGKLMGNGICYRCGGKGFHTQADRKRNYGADVNYVVRGH